MTDTTAASATMPEPVLTTGAKPFSAFERMVAWRYLRAKRREGVTSWVAVISFLGIMLGVATLIVVMSVMNGFRAELLDRILGINGHVILQPIDRQFDDYAAVASRINQVAGVKFAVPMVEGQVMAQGPSGTGGTGAVVKGVRAEDLARMTFVSGNLQQGTFDNFDSAEGVAVGSRMAENLGLSIGDLVTLISPDGDVTPIGTTPRVKAYPVTAIYEIGMSEYDSLLVFMPLAEAQLFFNSEGIAQTMEIFVDNPDLVDDLKEPIEAAAQRDVFLTDWRFRNQTFFSALEVERNVMFMILSLVVLVAALNIISGLIMLVKDKSHDIAILRTMGATKNSIMRIFVMTGAAVGIAGTVAGVILGYIICINVESIRQFFSWLSGAILFNPELYFLSRLPAKMDPNEVFMVVCMALVLTFFACIVPAWRAAKLDPVEALRYE